MPHKALFFCGYVDFPANSHYSHYLLIILRAAETKILPASDSTDLSVACDPKRGQQQPHSQRVKCDKAQN